MINNLFIFRRDLRLHDNTALLEASRNCDNLYTCFIFDERQIYNNPYKSDHALDFMIGSIVEIKEEINKLSGNLIIRSGKYIEELKVIIENEEINFVYINIDYTHFARERDKEIIDLCNELGIGLRTFSDYLLCDPGSVLTREGEPYRVFTYFFNAAKNHLVKKPDSMNVDNFSISKTKDKYFPEVKILFSNTNIQGRRIGLKLLNSLKESSVWNGNNLFSRSDLAPHIKFGTLSIREIYFNCNHILDFIRALYWREFFTHIAYLNPLVFGNEFRYSNINWQNDDVKFDLWKNGKTGFPLIDAGMRELIKTGRMANRVRMVSAVFFCKNLMLNWRDGERYFASKLVDYDPSINNGNWQWCSGTGCDAMPYFRYFNPYTQQKKFDPKGTYVKKWVNELNDSEGSKLSDPKYLEKIGYLTPIIDLKESIEKYKILFKSSR
ncbi:MAG: deoxyribodipyrimidine photo-lyase [Candidatus Delongbacteria bacterium]|nr:deoxyribodipyrimidine photo-lyase [Candidatus Delongbacteria bacterium]MBN2835382.1 deoxyribodipyrimidine photo-lyase [Candidatus Delongbacteria bacterium]